ncbi:MAG: helix-turn-helix domain-containing protein [Actinomycetota bacterium]|jgi:HTH-type transcriptional regulator/antitoxin HigA|nr:helix-turn-helix domain-containing protein [Actinomycetota bacterium]
MATELTYDWTTDSAVSPGETIREILNERAITQVDFALRLGKSEKFVSQLVNGKASLTHETALELERVLGVPSSFWNNAEARYRDVLARQRTSASYAEQSEWAESFPLKEMAEHGWIAKEADPARQTQELLSFFGVSSAEAYQSYWSLDRRLAARMSTAYTAETPAIAAWLRAGEKAAESIPCAPYDAELFRKTLSELRPASRTPLSESLAIVQQRCADAGVAVVLIPDLPKTRCHAVSWWASRSRAVIELGLRYKTQDQVWFSLFHEAGHLLLDDRTRTGICDLDSDQASEARMDSFAADTLIPSDSLAEFLGSGRPTKASVRAFAREIDIAPGIVVGHLQRDEIIPYGWLNDLKKRLGPIG